jgi:hypothetical protein
LNTVALTNHLKVNLTGNTRRGRESRREVPAQEV